MADETQSTFEGAKYGSTLKIKAGGAELGDKTKVPRGAGVYFVGTAEVEAVTFAKKGGMSVREHVAKPEALVLVPEDVVNDIIEEQREVETGQPRLLTDEGEVRRAGRLVTRARQLNVLEGNGSVDDVTAAAEFRERVDAHWATVEAIEADVDTYEDPEAFYAALEDELTFLAADLVAAVEWAHRGRHAAVEDKRVAAEMAEMEREQAERDAARAAGEAAAISSDDVADSEAAKLNVDDDGAVELDPEVVVPDDASSLTDTAAPEPDKRSPQQKRQDRINAEVQAEVDARNAAADYDPFEDAPVDPALAEPTKMASEQQRVAISRHLLQAGGNERLAQEWAEWCAGHDVPQEPAKMTFDQARKALVFLGDAENAEADG